MFINHAMGPEPRHEWPADLDVQAFLSSGWSPSPFREFIVKVHSRCDLSCDYCYMYEMADSSWKSQPKQMSPDVVDVVAARIAEHAEAHRLDEVEVIRHGGEPLLAGVDRIRAIVTRLRTTV